MTNTENLPELLGLAEIADLYSVSKTTVGNWTRRADWPRPICNLKMGPVWSTAEVLAHKTPASRQQFQFRCASCYSGIVQVLGLSSVRCVNCGELSTLTIEELPAGPQDAWPSVVIRIKKEEAK